MRFRFESILLFATAAGLILLSACLCPGVVSAVRESPRGDFRSIITTVRKTCQSDFPFKSTFVDLNGFYARLSGRRLCNNVFRRPDGMLVRAKVGEPLDPLRCAQGISAFAERLRSAGAGFAFIQLPGKPDLGGDLLERTLDLFLEELEHREVSVLDLRARYAGTPELVKRFFFRTDHHWNVDAVMDASEILCSRMGVSGVFAPENWTRHELRDWFLGSQGKRVGVWFGGIDDLVYYTPVETGDYRICLVGPTGASSEEVGGFAINLDAKVAADRGDVHTENAYKIYKGIGGVWPCVWHHHEGAPLRKRVALVGDSFVRPMEACLTVAVEDLLVVDPRYPCGKTSALEKVINFQPDEVFVCINPYALVKNKGLYPQYAFCEFP